MDTENKKVLIVEDDQPQRKALSEKLTKEGFTVLEAKNGVEGLSMAIKDLPDAIILDVLMPKMDGIEMAKKLREDPKGKDVPIIILSNLGDLDVIQKAMESNIFEYFLKSDTKIEHIVNKVRELVNQ